MNFLNCIDAEFFRFMARRSTDDLLEFAFLSSDIFHIAPSLIGFFWYLLLAFAVTMIFSFFGINWLLKSEKQEWQAESRKLYLVPVFLTLILFARGGFHRIPLSIIDASSVSPPHLNSVVLNTSFTILKTLGKADLEKFNYPKEEIAAISPIIQPNENDSVSRLEKSNVILIITESLSIEYIGALNGLGKGYTPFVDSLCHEALVFTNAYANGHRSIEGVAAITASIPTLMYEPFTTSAYSENTINSLASLLKGKGYYTSFMHGGNKNSMNFNSYSSQAGYNEFYDRDDYPFPDKHYDGVWGISDHYFLNQCIDEYSSYGKTFFSTIFTLSSHHPYTIPEEYQNRFPKGNLPIHESIGYADQSLREFFQKASKTDWYENTLFVITADHTSLSEYDQYQTRTGSLRIPIIFYHPNDSLLFGSNNDVVQQVDIMPSILDLIGYDEPYFSFGKSAFDTSAYRIAVAFKLDQFQLLHENQLICFDGENTNFVYNTSNDPLLEKNLVKQANHQSELAYLKAYIQNYSLALNNNLMTFEAWTKSQQ